MNHSIVYAERGIYAGWPANHGAWQWGDELLVGFIRGQYGSAPMHNVRGPLEKLQARSLDGGETWRAEKPTVDFEGRDPTTPPPFEMRDSILRVCGGYDHGGDDCPQGGAFYLSRDKGHVWEGPFAFTGIEEWFLDPWCNTSRTAVRGDMVFLSRRYADHWGSDEVLVVRHDGERFAVIGTVHDAQGRVVMSAPVRLPPGKLRWVLAARRRGGFRRECWIDAYGSEDGGRSWHRRGKVGDTGGHNGNPPAMVRLRSGALICAFADRSKHQLLYSVSLSEGYTWSPPVVLRTSPSSDIGYPQLFERADGALVVVYYWSSAEHPHQHIAATIFRPEGT